ncbi:hypothetical protein ACIRRH_26210 [Kitasatospora sp. NPDC101235]|uniref:hypothetical protein n=1 Tax=Kitasatospora sp. NPDC101235 TaxID=3364101 RepID=UPI00381817DF
MPKTYDEHEAEQHQPLATGSPQPEGELLPLRAPGVGDPVVDLSRGIVGTYQGAADGRWQLEPLHGGEPWTADPVHVRTATVNERIRDGMRHAEPAADVRYTG